MLWELLTLRYINNAHTYDTLIYLGVDINVMTKETMEKLDLPKLQCTATFLQMVDRSTIKPKGVLLDVVVSIDLWE